MVEKRKIELQARRISTLIDKNNKLKNENKALRGKLDDCQKQQEVVKNREMELDDLIQQAKEARSNYVDAINEIHLLRAQYSKRINNLIRDIH